MKKRIEDLDPNLKTIAPAPQARWISARDKRFTLRGLAWPKENGGGFSRLPSRAENVVRDAVWQLAQCPAGVHLAFRTDASSLAIRAETSDTAHMPHMAMTGSNGLFLLEGAPGQMRPRACAVPEMENARFERTLFENRTSGMRDFHLHLPLYKELKNLELSLFQNSTPAWSFSIIAPMFRPKNCAAHSRLSWKFCASRGLIFRFFWSAICVIRL